jgi:hypothetical protein
LFIKREVVLGTVNLFNGGLLYLEASLRRVDEAILGHVPAVLSGLFLSGWLLRDSGVVSFSKLFEILLVE